MATAEVQPVLPDELLEDIFLRLDDAADLARASAACTSFRRVVSSRRFRSLHTPPVLGFLEFIGVAGLHFHHAGPRAGRGLQLLLPPQGPPQELARLRRPRWARPPRAVDLRLGVRGPRGLRPPCIAGTFRSPSSPTTQWPLHLTVANWSSS
jgi:hypothetical protein